MTEMSHADLVQRLRIIQAYADSQSQKGYEEFLKNVVIDSRPEPRRFVDVADPWQWILHRRMAPALEAVTGLRHDYKGPRNFFFVLPRGHDKSGAIGRALTWALAYGRRESRCVCCAASRDQANLIHSFMAAEYRLNPWFHHRLKFSRLRVEGTLNNSVLRVLAADADTNMGLREDIQVCDEVTFWQNRKLWDAILSGSKKRPGSVLIVIGNAGIQRSWQHEMFEEAKSNKAKWFTYSAPHHLASWITQEDIKELERSLPPGVARRVLHNKWTDPAEASGFVTREEAEACVNPLLDYKKEGDPTKTYVAAIDYGMVRDRTVMCVGHLNEERNTVILDRMDVLQGSRANRIKVEQVEEWMAEVYRAFHRPLFVVDPFQMEGTIQKAESRGWEIERFEARGGRSNYEMASNLRTLIANKRMEWYPEAGCVIHPRTGQVHTLVDELADVLLVARSFGYRIDHESCEFDDRVVAAGMCALMCVQRPIKRPLPDALSFFF